jgi:hypothetical protein
LPFASSKEAPVSVRHRFVAWFTVSYFAALAVLPSSLSAGELIKSVFKGPSVTTKEPCVERLAQEIDWLERHIDQYGSVVAKQPDVWGQARLTKHRDELEKQLFAQLNQFHVYLNGTLNRADQAFLANAFSLSASLTGAAPPPPVEAKTMVGNTPSGPIIQQFNSGHFLTQGDGEIALEPVVALDQLNRYINHLHELRRINEGDDTADSPGYSLNLVRLPVSVLPGRATNEGYGAEITITATPYLNDGLLPVTFRSLVINDLVDQLALPITKIADDKLWAEDEDNRVKLKNQEAKLCKAQEARAVAERTAQQSAETAKKADPTITDEDVIKKTAEFSEKYQQYQKVLTWIPADPVQSFVQSQANDVDRAIASAATARIEVNKRDDEIRRLEQESIPELEAGIIALEKQISIVVGPSSRTRNAQNPVSPTALVAVFGDEELLSIARSFGTGYEKRDVRWNDEPKQIVHLPDVQRFLQSELQAAYQCLARLDYQPIWDELPSGYGHATDIGGIVTALRRADRCQLEAIRNQFVANFRRLGQGIATETITCTTNTVAPSCLEALAWAILVESALLDAHLKGDMTSVAQLRGCGCGENCHLRFFMPDPGVEECQAFQEYVRCRWPIHVFALDPVTQDQNIGDAATIRREMQLAVSLAFVGGKMSASNFTKFTRQFEAQFETIALNRTVVGFSHGDDTFGWRFYPRFQTPPTKGNLAAFHETLWGKHKDCDLLNRKIEPGMRECVAVVIMPSFVPYVTFDVRSNWFRLNHHHGLLPSRDQAEPSMTDTMKLSRAVQQMHHTAACIRDANCYRGADVHLLMNRVHQLDRELPLQTMTAQVPIENTLGGFEMFSNGVTDLAPDLYGWYGGPGVFESPNTSAKCAPPAGTPINGLGAVAVQPAPCVCPSETTGTTLFLVGDHFSVHDTKVIAGDQCISDVTLLSRQIMRVTLPQKLKPNKLDGVEYVDVHVATPYGVTSHLHIPYIREEKPAAAASATWKWIGATEFEACVNHDSCRNSTICTPASPGVDKLRAVLSDRTLELPADGILAASLTLIPVDSTGKQLSDGKVLSSPLVFSVDSHEQGSFTNLKDADWNEAIARVLDNQPTATAIVVRALAGLPRPNKTFDKEIIIKVKLTQGPCTGPGAPPPAPHVPATPQKAAAMPWMQATPAALAQPNDVGPVLDDAVPAEALTQPIAIDQPPLNSTRPTELPVISGVRQFFPTTVVGLPQSSDAATTTIITGLPGIPVTGQPVPVPVLVPALPAPAQPVTPAPQRHPCPCKSLRFAVPGCESSEAFPGDDLSAAPPLRNLRRMLGWEPSHRGGEPRFLDPELLPAAYMQPLPQVHSN